MKKERTVEKCLIQCSWVLIPISCRVNLRVVSLSVFRVCDNEHSERMGDAALWPSPTHTSPSSQSAYLPASPIPGSPPSSSHPSKDKLVLRVARPRDVYGYELWTWMAQCFSQGHEYSALLLRDRPAHSHPAFPLFKLTISSCYEYRSVLRKIQISPHSY